MKKLFCLLVIFAMAIPVFAEIIVYGHAPTVTGIGSDIFNQEIDKTFTKALNELKDQLSFFRSPDNFLRAMGNSSVYASHGATTRAYGGYKKFTATIGPTFGFQLPSGINSIGNEMNNLADNLKRDGDINLGVNPNVNLNLGLNMGMVKLNKLYLGLRFGYFGLPKMSFGDNFKLTKYNNLTLGITANYQLLPSLSLAGFITWRGLSLGSGFIFNRNNMNFDIIVKDIEQSINADTSLVIERPKAAVNLTTNTYTIPLEAITAIKLVIFNIPLGIGADLAFGKTTLGAGVNADIDVNGLPAGYTKDKKGDIVASGEVSNTPSVFNFKIMTGLGFSMGPVIVDIPITFYPASHGYNFGFTIGALF